MTDQSQRGVIRNPVKRDSGKQSQPEDISPKMMGSISKEGGEVFSIGPHTVRMGAKTANISEHFE